MFSILKRKSYFGINKDKSIIVGFAAILILLIAASVIVIIFTIESQTSIALMVIEVETDSYLQVKNFLTELGYSVEIIQSAQDLLQLPLAGYDLIFDTLYLNGSLTADALESYVEGGGTLVLTAGSPFFMANATSNNTSLHKIEHWFGAGKYNNTGGYASLTIDHPFEASLLNGTNVFLNPNNNWSASIQLPSPNAHIIAKWENGDIYAFYHSYGMGRVYYQAHLPLAPDNLENYPIIQQNCEELLKGALTWCKSFN